MTTKIEWTNPELLANADTWSAYQTIMVILAERGETPSADAIKAQARAARSWALSQPDHVCDRWAPAYARVIGALS